MAASASGSGNKPRRSAAKSARSGRARRGSAGGATRATARPSRRISGRSYTRATARSGAKTGASPGLNTLAVHAGEPFEPERGLFTTPIIQQATFAFRTTREMVDSFEGRSKAPVYTRWSNPTVERVERKIAMLEGGERCLLFSSGMAAITSSILALARGGRGGSHVVSADAIYGGAYEFLSGMAPELGIQVTFVDASRPGAVRAALRPETRLIYAESPVNPTLRVLDLPGLAKVASASGRPLVVDGTFASPVNQRPLELGASLVVHSATKYLGGHSDLVMGAAIGPRRLIDRLWQVRKLFGGVVDPHQAWLLGRGLRTLGLRVERQNLVALAVARFLEGHRRVARVHYPGLPSHPQHALARRQMRGGFGGMVTFEVRGGLRGAVRVADRLRLIRLGTSLGGVESICSHPRLTSHLHVPDEMRRRAGIADGMIRLSCGIEDPADVIGDLEQALHGA